MLAIYQAGILRLFLKFMKEKWIFMVGATCSMISHFLLGLAFKDKAFILIIGVAVCGVYNYIHVA